MTGVWLSSNSSIGQSSHPDNREPKLRLFVLRVLLDFQSASSYLFNLLLRAVLRSRIHKFSGWEWAHASFLLSLMMYKGASSVGMLHVVGLRRRKPKEPSKTLHNFLEKKLVKRSHCSLSWHETHICVFQLQNYLKQAVVSPFSLYYYCKYLPFQNMF